MKLTSICGCAPATSISIIKKLFFLAPFIPLVRSQAIAEPPDGQILLGVWTDTGLGDTPSSYNARVGYNMSVFQIAIDIPQTPYNYVTGAGGPPPEYTIEQTDTSAAVFLTVYPTSFGIQEADYITLAQNLKNYTDVYNRTTFLRFAPEMQGTWMVYGNQPASFVPMWKTMYTYIKQYAPNTIIVWSPNTGQGYPYGQQVCEIRTGTQDAANCSANTALLDTNNDGQFSALDDPFSPYYPGDDYVDWIGLSIYWKGANTNEFVNAINTPDFCAQAWNTVESTTDYVGVTNFYQTYCAQKPTKACLFSESGNAYHTNDTNAADASQIAMQSAWITDCITNSTFWNAFPRIKAYIHFEWLKLEYVGQTSQLNDYRLTNTSSLLQTYQSALAGFSSRVQWATYRAAPSSIPSSGRPQFLPGASNNVSSAPAIVFQTQRLLDFTNPSLFGLSSAERLQIGLMALVTTGAVVVGAATLLLRAGTL